MHDSDEMCEEHRVNDQLLGFREADQILVGHRRCFPFPLRSRNDVCGHDGNVKTIDAKIPSALHAEVAVDLARN